MRGFLIGLVLILSASPAFAGMTMSFQWGPTKKCFDRKSPPIELSGVPKGTKSLDIRMVDLQAPNYPHGGAKIAYSGKQSLPYGAFKYRGPCPPSPHQYRITVKALDAAGKVLATSKASRIFPPR